MATEKKKVTKVKNEIKKVDINKEEILKDIKSELTTKIKTQITKELIDEIKTDVSAIVKEEVRNDLKREIDNEIKKSSRRNMRGKRGKIFRRDIAIIILLTIIAYLVYFMYNHNYVSFSINSNMNNVELTNDKKVVKTNNDYSYLLDNVNVKLPFENSNSLYLYLKDYNESSINDSIKLTMAYNYINKDEFSVDEIRDAYVKLFNTDKNFKNTSFDYECKKFKYDDATNTYNLVSNECINTSSKEVLERIINTGVKNDKVVITTVVGVYDNSNNSLYNYKNIYDPIAVDLNSNFNIIDYQNKLSTYKYTFVGVNGNYYFDSIKKLS